MKLHRTTAYLGGRSYTLITPRPSTTERFAVNHCHGMWHVLSEQAGTRLFARLLWGLSFDRHENTVVVIDHRFLAPDPFDGARSMPIALVPQERTPFGDGAARALRRALPSLRRPQGTVRWLTGGLDTALADRKAWWERQPTTRRDPFGHRRSRSVLDTVRAGVLVLPGDRATLRAQAVSIASLAVSTGTPMDYAESDRFEFQVFHDFRRRVDAARVARREIEATPLPWDRMVEPVLVGRDVTTSRIWSRGTEIRERRMRGRPSAAREAVPRVRSVNEIERSGATPRERQENETA